MSLRCVPTIFCENIFVPEAEWDTVYQNMLLLNIHKHFVVINWLMQHKEMNAYLLFYVQ